MSRTIPLNSLVRHTTALHEELTAAAKKVVCSGYYILGPQVDAFESAFAGYCGTAYCAGVGNGTDALELALRAVGVGQGDRVAVVANAAMYSTTAVLAAGAIPVFVDVDRSSTMDPAELQSTMSGQALKAVIVTHLYGRLADMASLVDIAHSANVAVIEDCAQAHGARTADGRMAGSLGDIASFSFYPTKNLGALGDGGAVVTNDAHLNRTVRQLRQYGWGDKYMNELSGGRNSRLDEMQAAMLNVMLPHLDGWNARRRDIANQYSQLIRNPAISTPPVSGSDYVAHLYVVRTNRREELRAHLLANGIASEVHYPVPDHRQPCLAGRHADVSLPHTEHDAGEVLSLPCFPELTDEEVDIVVNACNRF